MNDGDFIVKILSLYIILFGTHFFPVSMSRVSTVLHTEVRVIIGLKNVFRVGTSIQYYI